MSTESIFSMEICIQFWKNSSMKGHSNRLAVQKMRFFVLVKAVIRKVEKNDDVRSIVFKKLNLLNFTKTLLNVVCFLKFTMDIIYVIFLR